MTKETKTSTVTHGRINDESVINFQERNSIDLVQQVLNGRLNVLQEFGNINDLFSKFGNVLNPRMSKEFAISMENTEQSLFNSTKQKDVVNNLKSNDPNSFLIVPLLAYGHLFASVIRKQDENFSVTIVNKGARGLRAQFEEFVLPKRNLNKILDVIGKENGAPIEEIYKGFQALSTRNYRLQVEGRNQKVGNCFIKEPENAIKFAVATRNFKSEDFEKLRSGKEIFHSKWDQPTVAVHRAFVNEHIKTFPHMGQLLSSEFNTYAANKMFRKQLYSGLEPQKALIRAFDKEGQLKNLNTEDRSKILLSRINFDTLLQVGSNPKFIALVDSTKDQKFIDNFNTTKTYTNFIRKHSSEMSQVGKFEDLLNLFGFGEKLQDKIKRNLDETAKSFPDVVSQLKLDYHIAYFIAGAGMAMKDNFKGGLDKINVSIDLYPSNSTSYLYRGIIQNELGNKKEAMADVYYSLNQNPNNELAQKVLKDIMTNRRMDNKLLNSAFDKFKESILMGEEKTLIADKSKSKSLSLGNC